MDIRKIAYFIVVAGILSACGGGVGHKSTAALSPEVAFDSLITYIERSGDFINSPYVPAMISAGELRQLL